MEKVILSKRESFNIINPIYFKLARVLEAVHYGRYHKEYYSIIQQEEKEHRRFCPEGVTCGLTLSEASKLFYVQTLFEYLIEGRTLSSKDYLHVRKSHFFACSLAENYKEELTSCFSRLDFDKIRSIDYAVLMQ